MTKAITMFTYNKVSNCNALTTSELHSAMKRSIELFLIYVVHVDNSIIIFQKLCHFASPNIKSVVLSYNVHINGCTIIGQ